MSTILYSFFRSSCSWRVRAALNLKNIDYELKAISITPEGGLQQLSDEFRAINPMGQVPALQIDGRVLIDSMAIIFYLEETRSQVPLLPKDIDKRVQVYQICNLITSGIQPLQNVGALSFLNAEARLPWAQRVITNGFGALEKILSQTASKYCVGDDITMADCCLVPQVFNARKFKVDVSAYPIIERIDKELAMHPAFRASHPHQQPDCPAKEKSSL